MVAVQTAEANCTPLSDTKHTGMPKRATQPPMKASAQSAAVMPHSGNASSQRVALSTAVSMYAKPPAVVGSGPTRSTCTCENLHAVLGKFTVWAFCCTVTLAALQAAQSLHQATTFLARPGHKNLLLMSRVVALTPGWANPCTASNTLCRSAAGMSGLIMPLDVSTSSSCPSTAIFWTLRTDELCALAQSAHAGCAAAISETDTGGGGDVMEVLLYSQARRRNEFRSQILL
jgi:hypothetical protein